MTTNIKIVTFNLRCVWNGVDKQNSFVHRAGLIWEKISKEKPDVIAFQECVPEIVAILKSMFSEYLFLGHGRNNDYDGEGLYTAIKISDFDLLDYETFWLSLTPYIAGSRFENQSECPRTVVVSSIRHKKTGKIFSVYNVHLDHISESARVKGVKAVIQRVLQDMKKREMYSVMLGDFNGKPDEETIKIVSEDLFDVTKDSGITFHDFHGAEERKMKIDYIFISDNLKENFTGCDVWKDTSNGISLSDHYPLCANFKI